ncbi:unnamed protein product [Durusdinium trenchii]|uniref:peptidylprolyl isomerase n=1 Tax=Durusdinium trenchii TaxID=1381693 RepID=A0ABP0NYY1_9DINO
MLLGLTLVSLADALDLGEAARRLEGCAQLLLETRDGGRHEELMACRVPLLGSLHEDQIPGYSYNATEDCDFWASYAARDRHVEGSSILDFMRLAAYRYAPFDPPLRPNGTALYIGAHRGGEDGLEFHRRGVALQMHLFEPSPTFFRSLVRSLHGVPGFTLHNYGLGAKTRRAFLRVRGTASRVVEGSEEDTEAVLIRSTAEAIPEVLAQSRQSSVELLHVNCEGCEYDVVQGLGDTGQLARISQVQLATHLMDYEGPSADFHEAVSLSLQVSVKRYCAMHRTLSQTHERAWGLPWVWERWTKRNKREELTATAKSSPRAFLVKWGQRPKPGEVNRLPVFRLRDVPMAPIEGGSQAMVDWGRAMAGPMTGGYSVGFQLTPLGPDGDLTAHDFKGGPHPVEKDPIFNLCTENREKGNKLVQEGKFEEAIARYSEMIMQSRALEGEQDVQWTDEGRDSVRQLRAAAYLNLSLCFLKLKQWQHCVNTATRALQGDKDPPDPKENVLPPEKKAKALFRRALAQKDGFEKLDEAVKDLKTALEYVPEDKSIQQELQRVNQALLKEKKKADKKLSGFLSDSKTVKSGEGIFSESDRQRDTSGPELPADPVKVRDGLWLVPKDEDQDAKEAVEAGIDLDELGREINELREDKPEVFSELREKMKTMIEAHMER